MERSIAKPPAGLSDIDHDLPNFFWVRLAGAGQSFLLLAPLFLLLLMANP